MFGRRVAPKVFLYTISIIITTFVSGAMFGSTLSERPDAIFYGTINITSAILLYMAFMKFLSNTYYNIVEEVKFELLHTANSNA